LNTTWLVRNVERLEVDAGRVIRNSGSAFLIVLLSLGRIGVANAQSGSHLDVNGAWKGTRAASGQPGPMGAKVQSISFELIQNDQTITGSYRCYPGKKANVDCPNPIGKITTGTLKDDKIELTVQTLPNQVRCLFKGTINVPDMSGSYSCYAGGSLSSIGQWKVKRE
jgi:hypothetical protein